MICFSLMRFELRRERHLIMISLFAIGMSFLLLHALDLSPMRQEQLRTALGIILPLGGALIGCDLFTRDFQQKTMRLVLSLPLTPGMVFRTKFVTGLLLGSLLFFAGSSAMTGINGAGGVFSGHLLTVYGTMWFALYCALIFCCIAFRGTAGFAVAFGAIPFTALAWSLGWVWKYAFAFGTSRQAYQLTRMVETSGHVIWTMAAAIIFLIGAYWCFVRCIAHGRSIWRVTATIFAIQFLIPFSIWVAFYAVQIPNYLALWNRLEKSGWIETPGKTIEISQAIWEKHRLASLDLSHKVAIDTSDFRAYLRLKKTLRENLANEVKKNTGNTVELNRLMRVADAIAVETTVERPSFIDYDVCPDYRHDAEAWTQRAQTLRNQITGDAPIRIVRLEKKPGAFALVKRVLVESCRSPQGTAVALTWKINKLKENLGDGDGITLHQKLQQQYRIAKEAALVQYHMALYEKKHGHFPERLQDALPPEDFARLNAQDIKYHISTHRPNLILYKKISSKVIYKQLPLLRFGGR